MLCTVQVEYEADTNVFGATYLRNCRRGSKKRNRQPLVKVLWMYLIKPLCLLTVICTDTGRAISAKVVMAIMEFVSSMKLADVC
jgi:cell division protein FtsW (lipid II flippase)